MGSVKYHRVVKQGGRYYIVNRYGYRRPQGFYTREAAEKVMAMYYYEPKQRGEKK